MTDLPDTSNDPFPPPAAPRAVPVVKLSYEEHRGSSSPSNMPSNGSSIVSPRDFGAKPRSAIRTVAEDAGSEAASAHAHDALIEKSDEEKEEEEEVEGKPFAVKSKGPTFFGLVGLIETKFPKKAVPSTPRYTRGTMDASMDRSGEILPLCDSLSSIFFSHSGFSADFIDYATLPAMSPRQPLDTRESSQTALPHLFLAPLPAATGDPRPFEFCKSAYSVFARQFPNMRPCLTIGKRSTISRRKRIWCACASQREAAAGTQYAPLIGPAAAAAASESAC